MSFKTLEGEMSNGHGGLTAHQHRHSVREVLGHSTCIVLILVYLNLNQYH